MNFTGDRYYFLRDNYILPMVDYKVTLKKLPYNNLKQTFLTKATSVSPVNANEFEITFNKEDFFKGLIGDIEQFLIKSTLQRGNILQLNKMSECWKYVTRYYFDFYSLTAFLRILFKGLTYLDSTDASNLSNIYTTISGGAVRLNTGNYHFKLDLQNIYSSQVIVNLKKEGKKPHDAIWNLFSKELQVIINSMPNRDYEYTLLKSIQSIFNATSNNFPSEIRNKINYQGKYSLDLINKKILYSDVTSIDNDNLSRLLMAFDDTNTDLNYLIKYAGLTGEFIHRYSEMLFEDYKKRIGKYYFGKMKNEYLQNVLATTRH